MKYMMLFGVTVQEID